MHAFVPDVVLHVKQVRAGERKKREREGGGVLTRNARQGYTGGFQAEPHGAGRMRMTGGGKRGLELKLNESDSLGNSKQTRALRCQGGCQDSVLQDYPDI